MIRKKETVRDPEPVRYDLGLLDSLYLIREGNEERLSNWINLINAFGVTIHFEAIISDIVALQESPPLISTGDYSWTANLGFVYTPGDSTLICTVSLDCLRKDYGRGALKADEEFGQRLGSSWHDAGEGDEIVNRANIRHSVFRKRINRHDETNPPDSITTSQP